MAKPKLLDAIRSQAPIFGHDFTSFSDSSGKTLTSSGVNIDDYKEVINNLDILLKHIANNEIHTTQEDKDKWNNCPDIAAHAINQEIHVTPTDRESWDAKETPNGAQAKANVVQTNLNYHINDDMCHITEQERVTWSDTYSRNEIDNRFSQLIYGLDWKETVPKYEDLYTEYPDADAGWTANTLDGITYRFNGEIWEAISANSIPMVTHDIDGLMSRFDKQKIDTIEENANYYVHPDNENVRHVTDEQIASWDAKPDSVLVTYKTDGLMSIDDKIKLDSIEEGATYYEHPEFHYPSIIKQDEDNRFVSDVQIRKWDDKADSDVATVEYNGLMSREDKLKLDNIDENANNYEHPGFHLASIIVQDAEHRFCTDNEKSRWSAGLAGASMITPELALKLSEIEDNANNYVHPEYHDPSIIKVDNDHRFVSIHDKKNWDGKKDDNDFILGTGIFMGGEKTYPDYDIEVEEVVDGWIVDKLTGQKRKEYLPILKGVVVEHGFGHTSFAVSVMRSSHKSDESVGEIYCIKTNKDVTIYNTGPNKYDTFDFSLIRYEK